MFLLFVEAVNPSYSTQLLVLNWKNGKIDGTGTAANLRVPD